MSRRKNSNPKNGDEIISKDRIEYFGETVKTRLQNPNLLTNEDAETYFGEMVENIMDMQNAFNLLADRFKLQGEVIGFLAFAMNSALPKEQIADLQAKYKLKRTREINAEKFMEQERLKQQGEGSRVPQATDGTVN